MDAGSGQLAAGMRGELRVKDWSRYGSAGAPGKPTRPRICRRRWRHWMGARAPSRQPVAGLGQQAITAPPDMADIRRTDRAIPDASPRRRCAAAYQGCMAEFGRWRRSGDGIRQFQLEKIGRYIVKRLTHKVCGPWAVRDRNALFLADGRRGPGGTLAAPLTNEMAVHRAVDGADLIVNAVGILAEPRRGDFQRIQADGAGLVARLAKRSGVANLLQISAIGADPSSPSRYGASKGIGETLAREAFPGVTILRPSLVFGPEDHLFNRFAAMARVLPFMPVICGDSQFQPVYVGDVADAVMAALGRADAAGAVYELGGPRVWQFRELLAYILTETAGGEGW